MLSQAGADFHKTCEIKIEFILLIIWLVSNTNLKFWEIDDNLIIFFVVAGVIVYLLDNSDYPKTNGQCATKRFTKAILMI